MLLEIPDYDYIWDIGYVGKDIIRTENRLETRIVLTAGIVIYDEPNDFLRNLKSASILFMGPQFSETMPKVAEILEYFDEDVIGHIADGRLDSEILSKYRYILNNQVILPGQTYLELSSMYVPNVSNDKIQELIKQEGVGEKLEVRILARNGKFPTISKLEAYFIDGHVLSETLAVSPNSYSKKRALDLTRLFLTEIADKKGVTIEKHSEKKRLILFERVVREVESGFYRGRDEEEPVSSRTIRESHNDKKLDETDDKKATHEGNPEILH